MAKSPFLVVFCPCICVDYTTQLIINALVGFIARTS